MNTFACIRIRIRGVVPQMRICQSMSTEVPLGKKVRSICYCKYLITFTQIQKTYVNGFSYIQKTFIGRVHASCATYIVKIQKFIVCVTIKYKYYVNQTIQSFFFQKAKLLPLVIKCYNCECYIQIPKGTRQFHLMWRPIDSRKGEDDHC